MLLLPKDAWPVLDGVGWPKWSGYEIIAEVELNRVRDDDDDDDWCFMTTFVHLVG